MTSGPSLVHHDMSGHMGTGTIQPASDKANWTQRIRSFAHAKFRELVQRTLPQPDVPFARASPTRVQIIERYHYDLPISHLRRPSESAAPDGRILAHAKYDGDTSFSHLSLRDVQLARRNARRDPDTVEIGRVAFANVHRTDLGRVLPGVQQVGTTPLRLPLSSAHLRSDADLVGDRVQYMLRQRYQPQSLETIPLTASVTMTDAVAFLSSRSIVLELHVGLVVPRGCVADDETIPNPRITALSLDWPVDAPPDSVEVILDHTGPNAAVLRQQDDTAHIDRRRARYQPEMQGLTWSNLTMLRSGGDTDESIHYAAKIYLNVRNPSQIDGLRELRGRIVVELPDVLLSGIQARLYDATGRPRDGELLKKLTVVTGNISVAPEYAIERRHVGQHVTLQFLGVRPASERFDDTVQVLEERGFEREPEIGPGPECDCEGTIVAPICWYRKQIGANMLALGVSMCGSEDEVERKQADTTGRTITRIATTGRVKVHLNGALRADHATLTHELMRIHNAVRNRFRSAHETN